MDFSEVDYTFFSSNYFKITLGLILFTWFLVYSYRVQKKIPSLGNGVIILLASAAIIGGIDLILWINFFEASEIENYKDALNQFYYYIIIGGAAIIWAGCVSIASRTGIKKETDTKVEDEVDIEKLSKGLWLLLLISVVYFGIFIGGLFYFFDTFNHIENDIPQNPGIYLANDVFSCTKLKETDLLQVKLDGPFEAIKGHVYEPRDVIGNELVGDKIFKKHRCITVDILGRCQNN